MAGITTAAQWIAPLVAGASTVARLTDAVSSASDRKKSDAQALAQLQAQQAEAMRQTQENAALERQKIALDAQAAEDERRAALKRAVAKQRAAYGSAGTTVEGGSGEAVLLGLFSESDAERTRREQLDTLKNAVIDQNIAQQARLNVLQQSQLAQRNKIGSLSRKTGLAQSILSSF
jgi:hypothetical protein